MTMTVTMLEKMVLSEVENLHLRIDEAAEGAAATNERLDRIDRRLELLWVIVTDLKDTCLTKKDAGNFATKHDLRRFATKDDLKRLATKEDFHSVLLAVERIANKVGV